MIEKNFELLKRGDPKGLENIHALYNRRIFWLGKKIIDDEFVVDTLVQDTFLRLWECREKMETPLHILFFLRFVMKKNCYSHYSKPRNKFFSTVKSLDSFENYQDYLAGYDPVDTVQNLKDQEAEQRFFDMVNTALPLINPERRHLIDLCLKYGFRYKAIAQVMGKGSTETVNEVKRAIEDIKKIVDRGTVLEGKKENVQSEYEYKALSEIQSQVLKLRFEMNRSFVAIAQELNITPKEVQEEFMTAYRFVQQNQMQSL